MSSHSPAGTPIALLMLLALALGVAARAGAQELPEPAGAPAGADEGGESSSEPVEERVLAVLPFRIHSARPLGYLTESLAELLAARLAKSPGIQIVPPEKVKEAMVDPSDRELPDAQLRTLAERVDAQAIVSGSLTELAGRFSLDVRVTPADVSARSHSIVVTSESEEGLVQTLDELAERVVASVSGKATGQVALVTLDGAFDREPELYGLIRSRVGEPYDPVRVREDRGRLQADPSVASSDVEIERTDAGVEVRFRVVLADVIFGGSAPERSAARVAEVRVSGNKRIESSAIRARIGTREGEALRTAQVAQDVREVFALGFFRNVVVYSEDSSNGKILTFEVEENPVIRQISIEGNDNVDSEKVQENLTLTTGATLDQPLLHENVARIEALYRAEGYYLADVGFQIEQLGEGSVGVNFEVDEKEKLKLRKIVFEGNEAYSERELTEDFATKRWRFWSLATSWFDRSGTYSEPVFLRDLREVEKKYTDSGYLQAEIGEPQVDASEKGIVVIVPISEGPQYHVGTLDVSGDDTVDLEALRGMLKLEEGDVFNRSYLTDDVESLERHYTDRGFYFASVQPGTSLSEEEREVDVEFQVKKGPLYFIRHIGISGNTRTIDPVIRREMRVVEGQLYSARALQISDMRVRGLGFFEDVSFDPQPTENPSQLDLHVNVVERPTGSFSIGAGFSSQDKLVFTAALSQTNLFGRGYGVNLSADIGGRTNAFFLSVSDPYFLGTNFSFGSTIFNQEQRFESFEQAQRGIDVNLGHALNDNNTSRGFLRYSYAFRKLLQDVNVNAAASIQREIREGGATTSLVGLSMRTDTRNDRFSPTSGMNYGATAEFAGLGGDSRFVRLEGRFSWYLGAPSWLFDRSTFVVGTRIGYAIPLNTVSDLDIFIPSNQCNNGPGCIEAGTLEQIDSDLKLPLTERYFLGGIGQFQLRGFKARSVGPRRSILSEQQEGIFTPVGRQFSGFSPSNEFIYDCADGSDQCNSIDDRKDEDFADLDETDVIGGSSFITASFEYRFPVSEEIGLQAVLFMDMGNAFYEGQNLFDVTEWRYGYGAGLLWFSPFGPLQVVLGFPINPLSIEKSPVFEFSVGGFGL